jgi:adenosylcobinamide kinase/adenosylcobinamide-phosphate guanylyltransferase
MDSAARPARRGSVTLVLGGARSGKSRWALDQGAAWQGRRLFVATATAGDDEMRERLARHRAERGSAWDTIEEPLALGETLARESLERTLVLVDCLTFWLHNLLEARRDVASETTALVHALRALPGPVFLVANEVGLGIVPENALARRFRDEAGRLNQVIAASADRVVLLAAGLPLVLKENRSASTF